MLAVWWNSHHAVALLLLHTLLVAQLPDVRQITHRQVSHKAQMRNQAQTVDMSRCLPQSGRPRSTSAVIQASIRAAGSSENRRQTALKLHFCKAATEFLDSCTHAQGPHARTSIEKRTILEWRTKIARETWFTD
jgi:hypothetical protein